MFAWFDKSVLLHLRIPFSFFLMPVFCFALSQSPHPDVWLTIGVFLILHLFLYPASNAYNSFYDKDEGSIGGLEHPPPVSKNLLYAAWTFDVAALLLGALIGWSFVLALLTYGMVSKAYSYDKIRLKKYPVLSWLVVGLFQGAFTYLMVFQAINQVPLSDLSKAAVWANGGVPDDPDLPARRRRSPGRSDPEPRVRGIGHLSVYGSRIFAGQHRFLPVFPLSV
jgi:hypothetical protein